MELVQMMLSTVKTTRHKRLSLKVHRRHAFLCQPSLEYMHAAFIHQKCGYLDIQATQVPSLSWFFISLRSRGGGTEMSHPDTLQSISTTTDPLVGTAGWLFGDYWVALNQESPLLSRLF
jgi:hypothetical protein